MYTAQVAFVVVERGCGATGSHVTGRGPDRNRKCVMRMHNRKLHNTPSGAFSPEVTGSHVTGRGPVRKHPWPEVIVCACANGTFCTTTSSSSTSTMATCDPKGVEGCAHAQPEVVQYPPSGGLFTGSWLQEVMSFPPRFFLSIVVVQNVGWGVLYNVRVYSFPWLSAPFIFI